VGSILAQADGTSEEIDFVLRKELVDPASSTYIPSVSGVSNGVSGNMQYAQDPPSSFISPTNSIPDMNVDTRLHTVNDESVAARNGWFQQGNAPSIPNMDEQQRDSPTAAKDAGEVKLIAGQIVPPRKGSLVDLNNLSDAIFSGRTDIALPGSLPRGREDLISRVESIRGAEASKSISEPTVDETKDDYLPALPSGERQLPQIPTSQHPEKQQQQGQSQQLSIQGLNYANSTSIKTNFEYMEEYLEEIMKDTIDVTKLEALESLLRKSGSDVSPSSARRSILLSPSQRRKYSDSGLSEIMRSTPGSLQRPISDGKTFADFTRDRSFSQVSLKDLYDDIERDLDKSLNMAASAQGSNNSLSRSSPSYFFAPSVNSQEVGDASATPRGLSDKRFDFSFDVNGDIDVAKALERSKDLEIWLNHMQQVRNRFHLFYL
jgi:hypothetical protein